MKMAPDQIREMLRREEEHRRKAKHSKKLWCCKCDGPCIKRGQP